MIPTTDLAGVVFKGFSRAGAPGVAPASHGGATTLHAQCPLVGADIADVAFSSAGAPYFVCLSCFCGASRDADGFVSGLDFDAYVEMFTADC